MAEPIKVIAKAYLVDDSGNYVPGSEIRPGGELYRQREYYAGLGQVEIVQPAPVAPVDEEKPEKPEKPVKGKTAKGS